jgi:hypothetical protein
LLTNDKADILAQEWNAILLQASFVLQMSFYRSLIKTVFFLDLISAFEEDQRKVVFSALSDYLHLGLFTDISLTCGVQMLRAHKVVLAASSKFFRDAFKHCPSKTYFSGFLALFSYKKLVLSAMATVDLDKELAPHGLSLTFDDVQLVIGILYCVGTVEISSQRVESLLLIAQVLFST